MPGKTELFPGDFFISVAFDYRRALKGEWERMVVSA